VIVARIAYRGRGLADLHPADAVLKVPAEMHTSPAPTATVSSRVIGPQSVFRWACLVEPTYHYRSGS
jgi:hypothetical protein